MGGKKRSEDEWDAEDVLEELIISARWIGMEDHKKYMEYEECEPIQDEAFELHKKELEKSKNWLLRKLKGE